MGRLFEHWGVHYFASRRPEPGEHTDPEILAEFLEKCTVPEYQLDAIRLTRLDLGACGMAPRAPAIREAITPSLQGARLLSDLITYSREGQ